MSVFKSNSSMHGVALGLAGFFVFPLHDALAKLLVRDLSVWEIMFVRSSTILIIVFALNGTAPLPRAYRSPVRSLLTLRALIIVAAWALYYSAARSLALGEMVTIYFGSPILVALMAGPVLREEGSASRGVAVSVGVVGVHHIDPPDQVVRADQRQYAHDQSGLLRARRARAAMGLENARPAGLGSAARDVARRCDVAVPGVRSSAPRLGLHDRAARVHEPRVGIRHSVRRMGQ